MDDPFFPTKLAFDLGLYRIERMILSPKHWATFNMPNTLNWKITKFDSANAGNVPATQFGVYSFVVQPGIAGHSACSYLMYVGKAEDQSLRKRFHQYFAHFKDTSRRTNISKLLRLWQGHIWFCYAPIADQSKIDDAEQALLNAYLPPFNKRYKGVVAKQLRYLFS